VKQKKKVCARGHAYFGAGPCRICWPGLRSRTTSSKDVDAYIAKAPKPVQGKLKELRAAIKHVAPRAAESISYRMPYYEYKGRLAWFAPMKTHIGLYLRPPVIEEHLCELAGYTTTKSAVHFPLEKKLPISLIKKLVRARARKNDQEDKE
jgi:uncharacterized protein YdhG (YjbR/CyaY superfamily)